MRKMYFTFITFCIIYSFIFLSPAFAQNVIVVPNDLADTGANVNSFFPFNCIDGGGESLRYQQVYLSSEFDQGGTIDKISFRLASQFPQLGFQPNTLPDVQLDLSTTQAQPNSLSNTFSDNIGDDVTTVFMGDLVVTAQACDTSPCPFEVMIPLQNPFFYDPENGNLLFDMRIPKCVVLNQEKTIVFDFTTQLPTIVTRVTSTDVLAPTGGPVSGGLVTEFRFFIPRNVPTLSEWGLIAMAGVLGIVGFMVMRKKKATA